MSEPGKEDRAHRRADWQAKQKGGGTSERGGEPEKVAVRMPALFVIPAGTRPAQCGCGMWQFFIRYEGVTRSISIAKTFYSKTAKAEIDVPGVRAPTRDADGLGFDHHINCAQREQFRRKRQSAETPEQRAQKVRDAEQLAAKHGIKCSGAPGIADCNGDAVVAMLVSKRLFATPCSVHADKVAKIIGDSGRGRDLTLHALDEFLSDRGADVARQFAERAAAVRKYHTERGGVTVPRIGHL